MRKSSLTSSHNPRRRDGPWRPRAPTSRTSRTTAAAGARARSWKAPRAKWPSAVPWWGAWQTEREGRLLAPVWADCCCCCCHLSWSHSAADSFSPEWGNMSTAFDSLLKRGSTPVSQGHLEHKTLGYGKLQHPPTTTNTLRDKHVWNCVIDKAEPLSATAECSWVCRIAITIKSLIWQDETAVKTSFSPSITLMSLIQWLLTEFNVS